MKTVYQVLSAVLMMIIAVVLAGALTGCSPVKASTSPTDMLDKITAASMGPVDAQRLAVAKETFREDIFLNQVCSGLDQAAEMNPKVPRKVFQKALEKMDLPEMHEIGAVAAAQTFTLKELEALKTFNETPEGTSIQKKMPEFTRKVMGPLTAHTQQAVVRALTE